MAKRGSMMDDRRRIVTTAPETPSHRGGIKMHKTIMAAETTSTAICFSEKGCILKTSRIKRNLTKLKLKTEIAVARAAPVMP